MSFIKERANAKINLHLDVLSRREDGFHDIRTVMHSVTLCDNITVSQRSAKEPRVSLSVIGAGFLPTDKRNLAVQAAYLYMERAALSAAVHITLEKRIPVAAGLAGGSSDAAAVLRAMNKLNGRLFTHTALHNLACELGSDTAYCLYGKTALCEGRGEILTKLPFNSDIFFVIAIGNEHMSTPQAYKNLDELYSNFDGSIKTGGDEYFTRLMAALDAGAAPIDGLFNVFEGAVLPQCPNAKRIRARLLELGALSSMMSGSGPSVFGIFSSIEKARDACFALRGEGFRAYYARSIK